MKNLIVISGPTASGKSYLAEFISQRYDAVIINADSMQIYKELPILTSQPKQKINQRYRLYSVLDHDKICTVDSWQILAIKEISNAIANNKKAILVGGTGFYLKALLYGIADIPLIDSTISNEVRLLFKETGKDKFYRLLVDKDPNVKKRINHNDSQRMMRAMEVLLGTGKSITYFYNNSYKKMLHEEYSHISLFPKRDFLYENCNSRFKLMLQKGVIEEVEQLKNVIDRSSNLYKAIGFREILNYLDSKICLQEVIMKTCQLTRNYAKRQLTWFRNQMPCKICIEYSSARDLCSQAIEELSRKST